MRALPPAEHILIDGILQLGAHVLGEHHHEKIQGRIDQTDGGFDLLNIVDLLHFRHEYPFRTGGLAGHGRPLPRSENGQGGNDPTVFFSGFCKPLNDAGDIIFQELFLGWIQPLQWSPPGPRP